MLLDIVIIIDKLFQHWIAVFGCPRRFLGGNGGEFNNELFRNISELLNVEDATTEAESSWSNGITETLNAIIGIIVDKILNK